MLVVLDVIYTIVHIFVIFFNLTGWMFRRTRKLHLLFVAATCFCWLALGIWFGFGYCPVTDWQWAVKSKLGETNLPDSFITYLLNNIIGWNVSESLVIIITGITFMLIVLLTVFINFFRHQLTRIVNH